MDTAGYINILFLKDYVHESMSVDDPITGCGKVSIIMSKYTKYIANYTCQVRLYPHDRQIVRQRVRSFVTCRFIGVRSFHSRIVVEPIEP